MSDEQKEEMRRKQREYSRQYRQRKNAESHNSTICLDKENIQPPAYKDCNDTIIDTATTLGSRVSAVIGKYRIHDMNFIYTRMSPYFNINAPDIMQVISILG